VGYEEHANDAGTVVTFVTRWTHNCLTKDDLGGNTIKKRS